MSILWVCQSLWFWLLQNRKVFKLLMIKSGKESCGFIKDDIPLLVFLKKGIVSKAQRLSTSLLVIRGHLGSCLVSSEGLFY